MNVHVLNRITRISSLEDAHKKESIQIKWKWRKKINSTWGHTSPSGCPAQNRPEYNLLFILVNSCWWQYNNINIARGTTDPEIDSVTWTKFGNNMTPLTFVTNLTTSATCNISCKFGHQIAPLALVANLATIALLPKLATRLHYLHCYIALDCPIGIIS